MSKIIETEFVSPTKGRLSKNAIVEEITDFINMEPEGFYSLVIGSDSQTKRLNGKSEITFVTAIVVHRKGKGAIYFWKKEKQMKLSHTHGRETFSLGFVGNGIPPKQSLLRRGIKVPILREKIYTETLLSLATAQEIVPLLRAAVTPAKYDLEIHIDVGPLGPTREMIREVVGMVNGNGFIAKTKPDSWGASSVADKHT